MGVKEHYLLNPGHAVLTEQDKMILECAAEAKDTKSQWELVLGKVGAEKIEDLLDLRPADYDSCEFLPLLRRRLKNFQTNLYAKHCNNDLTLVCVQAAPYASPPSDPPIPCIDCLCEKHRPSKNREHKLKYWYFHAFGDGCKRCVKYLVKDMGVDKNEISDTQSYTAKEFAEFFKQQEMLGFLETL